jgi:hypothetical protein
MSDKNTEDIKTFLEKVIQSELSLKRQRRTGENIHKELFEQIIIAIEKVNNRSLLMEKEFSISHYVYDESFHEIIDAMFVMMFGAEATQIILFYLYERVNPDGTINELEGEGGKLTRMETPSDLWEALKALSTKKSNKK